VHGQPIYVELWPLLQRARCRPPNAPNRVREGKHWGATEAIQGGDALRDVGSQGADRAEGLISTRWAEPRKNEKNGCLTPQPLVKMLWCCRWSGR